MMERRFAKFFISLVRELIPTDHERDTLFEALRRYQSGQDLQELLTTLRHLLRDPDRLELYDVMRPLILLRHQVEYSSRVPGTPGVKLRIVRLERRMGENLGFCVKGGYEHGVGIFVTDVTPGSQADRQGLRVGDEIIRVNGFTISEAIHDDVLNLIRMREDIILKVTYIGMVPVKESPTDPVTWEYVEDVIDDPSSQMRRPKDLKVFVDTTGHASFGCGIRSGPSNFPGIFIERVRPESLAEQVGLEMGDQIVEVNETSFRKINHKEAVLALKSSRQLNMVIRKGTGVRLFGGATNGSHREVKPQTPSAPSPPPPEVVNRREATPPRAPASRFERKLSETQMIEQQLDMSPGFRKQYSTSSAAPSFSNRSPSSSAFSTSAEIHSQDEPYNPRGAAAAVSSRLPMGGAQAYLAERKFKTDHSNEQDLLAPPGDYKWSDKLPAGLYDKFNADVLDGRLLKSLTYRKTEDLGIEVEGGLGSPLGGKIMVAMIFEGGVAYNSGKIRVGDQLMMIGGRPLIGITVTEAEKLLSDADAVSGDHMELIYCESTLVNDEDSVTYF